MNTITRADAAETFARAAGWTTADLTPGMLVNENRTNDAGLCETATGWEHAVTIEAERMNAECRRQGMRVIPVTIADLLGDSYWQA